MTVARDHRTLPRYLAIAACAAISLLVVAVVAPERSVAQIGSQTGYQEGVPPEGGGGSVGGSGDLAGGGSGSALGGPSGNGTLYATGGGGASGGGAVGEGGGPAAGPGGQTGSNDEGASAGSSQLVASQGEQATGVLLTSDNFLLALAVAVAATGVGFGVNRLARRSVES